MPQEFKKENPSTFYGKVKKEEEVEAWLLGMKKYFREHDYFENMKARVAIFILKGKDDIWCEDLNNVKNIEEKALQLKIFKGYFEKKYFSERYYDNKANELYKQKLGHLTTDKYVIIFLELVRYAPYIKDEKKKFKMYLNGMP